MSDDSATARANKLFAEATTELEAVLSNNEWLAHTRMTAADVTAVGVIRRVQDLELFDLLADPHETKNLVKEHPDVVQNLLARIDGWWKVD